MSYTLGELAERLGAELHGDAGCRIDSVATLQNAGPGSISFLSNRRYQEFLACTGASAVILDAEFLPKCPVNALVTTNPYLAYARAAELLNPPRAVEPGVHETAWVSDEARVHPRAWIGPLSSVGAGACVGAGAFLGPGCVVEEGAVIGDDCRLVAGVTICRGVSLGNRVLLHPGVVVGGDGF
ncbi:MAG: LpxD N-terminal domain-containing protein, partial [Gammaproteobacteria bacterium]|nr:LpxD N-terminal domain-containing protein [Gammaproteobacteria bacterium]